MRTLPFLILIVVTPWVQLHCAESVSRPGFMVHQRGASVQLDPSGSFLLSEGEDDAGTRGVKVWHLGSPPTLVTEWKRISAFQQAHIASDNSIAGVLAGGRLLWRTPQTSAEFPTGSEFDRPICFRFNRDGSMVAIGVSRRVMEGEVRSRRLSAEIWATDSLQLLHSINLDDVPLLEGERGRFHPDAVAFSNDSEVIVIGGTCATAAFPGGEAYLCSWSISDSGHKWSVQAGKWSGNSGFGRIGALEFDSEANSFTSVSGVSVRAGERQLTSVSLTGEVTAFTASDVVTSVARVSRDIFVMTSSRYQGEIPRKHVRIDAVKVTGNTIVGVLPIQVSNSDLVDSMAITRDCSTVVIGYRDGWVTRHPGTSIDTIHEKLGSQHEQKCAADAE